MKFASILPALAAVAILSAVPFQPSARAASIDYGALGNFVENPNGTPSNLGNYVRVGTFATGFNFSLNSTNFAATNAAFTEYDNTVIGSGVTPPGEFFDTTPFLSGISGVRIYVWVFNSPNPAAATAWAIVTSNDGNWFGPADGPNSTSVDLSDPGVFIPTGALGQRVPTALGFVGFDIRMTTTPVPEPSTYAMIAVGLLGFGGVMLRRRRAAVAA